MWMLGWEPDTDTASVKGNRGEESPACCSGKTFMRRGWGNGDTERRETKILDQQTPSVSAASTGSGYFLSFNSVFLSYSMTGSRKVLPKAARKVQ